MARKLLIDYARSLVGVRWRHRGRNPVFGVDCVGLVVLSMRAAGVEMRDRRDYGREPWNDGLDREMREHFGAAVPLDTLQAGDIVTMRGPCQPAPGHVGIVAEYQGRLTLIHSYNANANEVVTEHTIDPEWRSRFAFAYRPFP